MVDEGKAAEGESTYKESLEALKASMPEAPEVDAELVNIIKKTYPNARPQSIAYLVNDCWGVSRRAMNAFDSSLAGKRLTMAASHAYGKGMEQALVEWLADYLAWLPTAIEEDDYKLNP